MQEKSELEQTIIQGWYGEAEIKKDEKRYYLGELKERIIRLLSKEQVKEDIIYPEIVSALQDKRASKMLINGELEYKEIEKYRQLAREKGKQATVVHNPEFKGNVGLLVASEQAIDGE